MESVHAASKQPHASLVPRLLNCCCCCLNAVVVVMEFAKRSNNPGNLCPSKFLVNGGVSTGSQDSPDLFARLREKKPQCDFVLSIFYKFYARIVTIIYPYNNPRRCSLVT